MNAVTWRPGSAAQRACRIVVPLGVALGTVGSTLVGIFGHPIGVVWSAGSGFGSAIYCWRWGLVPYLRADEQGLEIRNPRGVHVVEWRDVVDVTPAYGGLAVTTRRGVIDAWAVQKSNLMRWLGRSSRADAIAAQILAMRDEQLT